MTMFSWTSTLPLISLLFSAFVQPERDHVGLPQKQFSGEMTARYTKDAQSSLRGFTLRAVTAKTVLGAPKDEWNEAYVELWQFLADSLNFTLQIRTIDDHLPEAVWNSLLSMVRNGSAELSLDPVTMLPSTAINVSFTVPIHLTRFSVLVRGGANDNVRWDSYLQPFSNTLWFALLGSVTLLSLHLAVLWHLEGSMKKAPWQLSEALLCVLGAACLQGHPHPPHSLSARMIHISALLSAVLVVAVYSSSVTAFLTVTREDRPFTTLDQLLTHPRFRPVTLEGSPEHAVFQESQHPALVQHRRSSPPSSLNSLLLALEVTCGRNLSLLGASWSRRVPALVLSSLWAERVLAAAPCPLAHFPLNDPASPRLWAAFPLATSVHRRLLPPHIELINRWLQRMHEAGAIVRHVERISLLAQLATELRRSAGSDPSSSRNPRFTLTLPDVTPLLALLGCGASLAVVLLLVELAVKHLSNPKGDHQIPSPVGPPPPAPHFIFVL